MIESVFSSSVRPGDVLSAIDSMAGTFILTAFTVFAVSSLIILKSCDDCLRETGEIFDDLAESGKKFIDGVGEAAKEVGNAFEKGRQIYNNNIDKHSTYTLVDLTEAGLKSDSLNHSWFSRSWAYFGTAILSLARSIKHFILGVFSFLTFQPNGAGNFFYRAFIDITGFGIGLIGTVTPRGGAECTGKFFTFLWDNAVREPSY